MLGRRASSVALIHACSNEFWRQSSALQTRFLVASVARLVSAEDRGNYAQQTSLHAACEGNFAKIVVDLLAAGLENTSSKYFDVI